MPVTVTMPQLGESVTEGTITRWLKAVGDTVAADEPLLEVSTDKVDTEIPAPASGVLLSIDAAEDDTVEVGGVLAVIGEPDDAATAPSSEPSEPSEPAELSEPATPEPVAADTPAEPAAPA
ncbi:MAG: biotin/lipoyl-containing protein, partial [Candidatus Nanopelagicales bacterium]